MTSPHPPGRRPAARPIFGPRGAGVLGVMLLLTSCAPSQESAVAMSREGVERVAVGGGADSEGPPRTREPLDPAGLGPRIDALAREGMTRIGAVPGLAVSVVRADTVLYEGAWGVRQVAGSLPVDGNTGFYIASATKSFVALLTLLLDADGLVDIDAPLAACLPGLDLNGAADPGEITLRDHLRHTHGWEEDAVNVRTAYTDFMPPEELRRHLAEHAVEENGPYFSYDNIGYITADLCFRESLGESWKELLDTRVLAPAGMRWTTAYMSEAAGAGNLALPYLWDGQTLRAIPPKIDDVMHAAGGLVTTSRDAGRWVRLFLGRGRIDGERVFPTALIDEAITRQVDTDREFWEFDRTGYGLGWYDGLYRGDRMVHHFGGYPGAQAHISLMPERGVGVVALVNGGGAGAYKLPHIVAGYAYDLLAGRADALEHARAAVEEAAAEAQAAAESRAGAWERLDRLRADPPAPAHALERYVGRYVHPRYGAVTVSPAPGGRLWIDFGAREGDLVPTGGNEFLADWEPGLAPDPLTFEVPDDGPAGSFTWQDVLVFKRFPLTPLVRH